MRTDLALDLACALDPVRLSQKAGLEPDDWQARALRSTAKQILLLASRQSGKSQTVALMAVHEVIYRAPALCLCLSPSQRQSIELTRKISALLRVLGVPIAEESAQRLQLGNGSRVMALPGKDDAAIRGFSSVSLLLADEASRISDQLYYAARPFLAVSGGTLVALSTPWGKRGWLHHEFTEGGPEWDRYEVTAYDCPRISAEFLEQERRQLPDRIFRQEYLCNPPHAPIWMGDFSFRPLGEVEVGDTVIGWHQPVERQKRRLTRAKVLAVGRQEAKIVEVRMASGRSIYCTPDHRWLTMTIGSGADYFVPAKVGKRLVRVIDPTHPLPEELRWDAAWLGGIYDGEGCWDQIGQSESHNPAVYHRIVTVLHSLGFSVAPHSAGVYFKGGKGGRDRKQALVDFLNWTRPTKRDNGLERIILGAHFRHEDTVVDIRPAGRGEVVSMQTTTGNYVAWGYASKNCEFTDTEDSVFSYDLVQRALQCEAVPLFAGA